MKKCILCFLSVSLVLILCSFLSGEELTVRKITDKTDLPESFSSAFEEGDYLVANGKYLILIGGSSRTLQSVLNYPAGDAMGSIIGFVPAGKNLVGDLSGICVYHFAFIKQAYRIAYVVDEGSQTIFVMMIGKRENFYAILKRRL